MKVPVFLRGVFCGVCRVFCRVCEWLDGTSVRKAVGAGRHDAEMVVTPDQFDTLKATISGGTIEHGCVVSGKQISGAGHGDTEHSGAELPVGELSVGAELPVGAGHGMVCAGKRSPEVGDAVHGSAGVVGGGVGRLASYAMIDFVLYERLRRLGLLDCGVRGHNVGASDYSRHVIQPWSIWLDYELNPWDADIVKRVLRTKDGESRRLGYEKIIHICQERIRQLGG